MKRTPSTTIGWILRFSRGWRCTSFKKTAVKCQSLRLGNPSLYKRLNNWPLQTGWSVWNQMSRQLINLSIWIKFQNSLENPTRHTYMSNSKRQLLLNSKGQHKKSRNLWKEFKQGGTYLETLLVFFIQLLFSILFLRLAWILFMAFSVSLFIHPLNIERG